MIVRRPAADRGRTLIDWLDSWHSFSFGEYRDPKHMGFHSLRVINDDRFGGGAGFPTHPHRDMEILTWVLAGSLEHRDSLGTGSVIKAGDLQRMTAGTGIAHSEFNPSKTVPVHLLQIWIFPEQQGLKPGYAQESFPVSARLNQAKLIASRTGREGSLSLNQDVELYAISLEPGQKLNHSFAPGRAGWLQVATGAVSVNGTPLKEGDGAAITNESQIEVTGETLGEVLLFDLA